MDKTAIFSIVFLKPVINDINQLLQRRRIDKQAEHKIEDVDKKPTSFTTIIGLALVTKEFNEANKIQKLFVNVHEMPVKA